MIWKVCARFQEITCSTGITWKTIVPNLTAVKLKLARSDTCTTEDVRQDSQKSAYQISRTIQKNKIFNCVARCNNMTNKIPTTLSQGHNWRIDNRGFLSVRFQDTEIIVRVSNAVLLLYVFGLCNLIYDTHVHKSNIHCTSSSKAFFRSVILLYCSLTYKHDSRVQSILE